MFCVLFRIALFSAIACRHGSKIKNGEVDFVQVTLSADQSQKPLRIAFMHNYDVGVSTRYSDAIVLSSILLRCKAVPFYHSQGSNTIIISSILHSY